MVFYFVKNKVNVVVDKRAELIGILLQLSKYREERPEHCKYAKNNPDYMERIKKHFVIGKLKEHKIISVLNEAIKDGFCYHVPIQLACMLNDDYSLNISKYSKAEKIFQEKTGGIEKAKELTKKIQDFATKSDFEKFYNMDENQLFYQKNINNQNELLGKTDVVKDIKDYYGVNNDATVYILNILLSQPGGGGYGYQIGDSVYCSTSSDGNVTRNEKPNLNFIQHLFHEFSHPVINPLTEKYNNKVQQMQLKHLPAYGNLCAQISEYMVRAATHRFCANNGIDDEWSMSSSRKYGFDRIDDFENLFINYENNRGKYPSIIDCYPKMMKSMFQIMSKPNETKEQDLPKV